jgi:hypothetical protein
MEESINDFPFFIYDVGKDGNSFHTKVQQVENFHYPTVLAVYKLVLEQRCDKTKDTKQSMILIT